MESNQSSIKAGSSADEVSIKEVIFKIRSLNRYLISKLYIILIIGIISAAVGFLYAKFKTTTFIAELTFVLDDGTSSGGGLSKYSDIAAMAGIDVPGGSSGIFQGDNIVELYKSRLMIQKTLLTKVNFGNKADLLIDRYIQANELKKKWRESPNLKNIDFSIPVSNFTLQHDSIISKIVSDINKNYLSVDKPDKKLSIISVKTKSSDELFAKMFTLTIVDNVNSFYIQTKTKGSSQNVRLLQHQLDSIRSVLNSSISGSAAALDQNPNPNPALQVLRAPSQRKQIDVQANTAIYAEIVKNLELARGAMARETPLIQMIDQPILPLPNDKTSKLKAAGIGALIGVLVAIFVLAFRRVYTKIMS